NENKITYSLLQAIKNIEQNRFGHWGIAEWQEVKPKTINDKIYLILKNSGQPMHFTEIAEKINEIGFDKKKANPATVHNELILDERYVLTGRGTYALKEWAKA
ncbi:MAG: winged helix-turn-helix domain-containing protein, partial [Planctomycetes bacterium]|nr:winged helix-turn-helix domain-containing protein [Planctomycetota bacterium]